MFKKKPLKNPEAETSFLPDPEREREEQELREKLKQEWLAEQERIKSACLGVGVSVGKGLVGCVSMAGADIHPVGHTHIMQTRCWR